MKRALAGLIALIVVFASGCAPLAPGFYDASPSDEPGRAPCVWTRQYTSVVYEESDFIRGYFEPANLAAYRLAVPAPFTMPPRPMVRVSVLDYFGMSSGPVYLESEVSVLVLHEGQPGWFVLTMPVTDGDACAGGRYALGTPKVVRRITMERSADRYVGTSYARGGRAPEFALSMDVRQPSEPALEVLRFVYPFPDYYFLRQQVVKVGGLRTSADKLESSAPAIWKVRLGEARLEHPHETENLLQRLGVGAPLAGYWGRLKFRYTITPR